MASQPEVPDVAIVSLRGGMNDTDPPNALPDDQCVNATNVEWFSSTFAERRAGCDPLDLTGSGLDVNSTIVHLSQWYPNNDVTNPELWAVSATPGVSGQAAVFARRAGTALGTPAWFPVVPQVAAVNAIPAIFQIRSCGLNLKLFFAYLSSGGGLNGDDRLKVWDGSRLRTTGLFQANAPASIVDEGSDAYQGNRYFRIRYIEKNGADEIVRRSEPSVWNTTTPSGTGKGVIITRGSALSEGETHWELEASADGATFYRITTLPMSTLTYTDETPLATSYADQGPVSEDIGTYSLQPSAAFIAVDEDRLVTAGHVSDPEQMSNLSWSPVFNDPGVGNDERIPTNANNTVKLGNGNGGPVTGLTNGVNGVFYVFKYQRIYKATRTGDVNRAYDIKDLSNERGAIPGSVFEGIDENGAACAYFLDPVFGPSRVGSFGIQLIKGLRKTWKRVNLKASNVVACGMFYPYKVQAHWWVAVDGGNSPSLKMILQTSETGLLDSGGSGRGWSLADGRIAQAYCCSPYTEWVNDGGSISLSTRPFIGLTSPDFIQRCDVDITDAGQAYVASITTRPYILTGLLNKWGSMVASLLATALTGGNIVVRLIRDYGVETTSAHTVPLDPVGSETFVVKKLDDLVISEAIAVQVKISDS